MKRLTSTESVIAPSCPAFYQQGGILIESLIGMLILALIGGGIMHATARMTNAQRDMAINHLAVDQMRTMLMSRSSAGVDLCAGAHSIALPGQEEPLAVTVKGCGLAPAKITGIQIGGAVIGEQTIQSLQPLVLEVGQDDELVSVGGVAGNDS